jgi:hypothetical protein
MARVDGLAHCEDDEAEWFFRAARDLTTIQLRMAGEIVAEALPGHVGGAPNDLLVGVLQAFATNFAAVAISRRSQGEED